MTKASEYRDQSLDQLEAFHEDLVRKLFMLQSQRRSAGKLEKPHELSQTKKNIARILTVMSEKSRS